jgi:hypothetical protein
MMQAAQRRQVHHRCISPGQPMTSQVTALARRPGMPGAPQGRTLRRRQRAFTLSAE